MKSAHLRVLLAALVLVAAFVVAACGETKDENAASSDATSTPSSAEATADPNAEIPQGLKTVSIPKQLGNPYEEFEHSGVDEALKELQKTAKMDGFRPGKVPLDRIIAVYGEPQIVRLAAERFDAFHRQRDRAANE